MAADIETSERFRGKTDIEHAVSTTPIPGLYVVDRKTRFDPRGYFQEIWQQEVQEQLGLPELYPIQFNCSVNEPIGTLRGIHVEPWDKFVGCVQGEIFVAFVDLREGETFGTSYTQVLTPGQSIFVPRGVGNSYLTLTDNVIYNYLVNRHWRQGYEYPALRYNDPEVGIKWPLPCPEDRLIISDKDKLKNPFLRDVIPMKPRPYLIFGSGGQLGSALVSDMDNIIPRSSADTDISSAIAVDDIDMSQIAAIVNAGAYTKVDDAESNGAKAWAVNATGPSNIVRSAQKFHIPVVHISTDYVFDGGLDRPYLETDNPNPQGVYAASKLAGDLAVLAYRKGYVLRTPWLTGPDATRPNFVDIMISRALAGAETKVVHDERGRLTFTSTVVDAIKHLLSNNIEPGLYNLSSEGPVTTRAELAAEIFRLVGANISLVVPVSTVEYYGDRPHAPRPRNGSVDNTKIIETGFTPPNWQDELAKYVSLKLAN